MKLILIDGGPASGKNTLGDLLVGYLTSTGEKSVILDHDTYVEKLCPSWRWTDDIQKEVDLKCAISDFIADIKLHLLGGFSVVAIGVRYLTQNDVSHFLGKLDIECPIFLFHLSVPKSVQKQRLHKRGPHSLIDLDKDFEERNAITIWPGQPYQNISTPETDAKAILKLIKDNVGLTSNMAT